MRSPGGGAASACARRSPGSRWRSSRSGCSRRGSAPMAFLRNALVANIKTQQLVRACRLRPRRTDCSRSPSTRTRNQVTFPSTDEQPPATTSSPSTSADGELVGSTPPRGGPRRVPDDVHARADAHQGDRRPFTSDELPTGDLPIARASGALELPASEASLYTQLVALPLAPTDRIVAHVLRHLQRSSRSHHDRRERARSPAGSSP